MQKSAASNSKSAAAAAKSPPPQSKTTTTTTTTTAASIHDLMIAYHKQTSPACKALDGYLAFCMLTGIIQAGYCLLVSSFPYNAFIGTFAASVGSFVFAANLRLKWGRIPGKEPSQIEVIHSVIEVLVCSLMLHMFVANFIG